MKKLSLFAVFALVLMAVVSVSADYATYYDVITDAKKFLKDPIDESWTQSYDEVMQIASGLDGFEIIQENNRITLLKNNWTGIFFMYLYFTDGNLSAVDTLLTGWNIMALNYTSESKNVPVADQLLARIMLNGFTDRTSDTENTAVKDNIFPERTDGLTAVTSPALAVDQNSFLQVGFRPASELTLKNFWLEFIVTSRDFAENSTIVIPPLTGGSSVNTTGSSTTTSTGETLTEICDKTPIINNSSTTTCTFKNSSGEEVIDPDKGYSRRVIHYKETYPGSKKYSAAETEYFGPDGNPVMITEGYAVQLRNYSDDGLVITTRFLDKNRKPVTTTSEYAYSIETYNSDRTETITQYYDMNDQQVPNGSTGAFSIHKYYQKGLTRTDYLDENGELMIVKGQEYCTSIYRYNHDSRGVLISSSNEYLDLNGNPVDYINK